jgi:hypothetical protein
LCDIPQHVRFLEGGSCKEVIRRIDSLRNLAEASNQNLRIGGVVDQDWRSKQDQQELTNRGLFVLGVHEVENFFLHPRTLKGLMAAVGQDPNKVESLILSSADARAGSWIFNAARTDKAFRDYPEPVKEIRELVHSLTWADFQDADAQCARIVSFDPHLSDQQREMLKRHLLTRVKVYARKRTEGVIWKVCEGKEVFRSLVQQLGFADENAGERALSAIWSRQPEFLPSELLALRQYITNL